MFLNLLILLWNNATKNYFDPYSLRYRDHFSIETSHLTSTMAPSCETDRLKFVTVVKLKLVKCLNYHKDDEGIYIIVVLTLNEIEGSYQC